MANSGEVLGVSVKIEAIVLVTPVRIVRSSTLSKSKNQTNGEIKFVLINISIKHVPVQLKLDWKSRTWRLRKDRMSRWNRGVSTKASGRFVRKDWGVIWLQDDGPSSEPLVILWDSPNGAADTAKRRGTARVHLRSAFYHDQKFPWELKHEIIVPEPPPSGLRLYIADHLEKDFAQIVSPPSKAKLKRLIDGDKEVPLDDAEKRYVKLFGYNAAPSSGTNCYIMGALLASYAGKYKGLRGPALNQFIQARSLSTTTGLPERAKRRGAWVPADGIKLPKPGDFLALTSQKNSEAWAKRNEDQSITHVGALIRRRGDDWRTADMGQVSNPGGHGLIRDRTYYADGTLSSPGSTYKRRWVSGWVNIDKYFA